MAENEQSQCSGGEKLIFACSGAADVGDIADRAARKMTKDGTGRMFCLAGVGGNIDAVIKATKAASRILAIDGCELDCVKNCLQQADFVDFEHLRLTDLGLQKGASAASRENIARVVDKAAEMLA